MWRGREPKHPCLEGIAEGVSSSFKNVLQFLFYPTSTQIVETELFYLCNKLYVTGTEQDESILTL